MANNPSERRLTENEITFRRLNEQTHQGLVALNELASEDKQSEFKVGKDDPLYFFCECSDLKCTERMRITFREYGKIHRNRSNFIVSPGHESITIERIVKKNLLFYVVNKYSNLPERT
jgi:hypothetical protein